MSIMVFSYTRHTNAILYILSVQRRRDKILEKRVHFLALGIMLFIFVRWGEERENITKEGELKTS